MKIGIVLFSEPGLSETFFRNKIRLLKECGYEVHLFVDSQDNSYNECSVHVGFKFQKFNFIFFYKLSIVLSRIVLSPIRCFNLWRLNKYDGKSVLDNLKSILFSSHIIGFNLDWLHFGFASVSVNRENLASVLGAKMAVSIRGYDIDVLPVKNPGIYDLLWKKLDKLHFLSDGQLKKAITLGFDTSVPHLKISPAIDLISFSPSANFMLNKSLRSNSILIFSTIARLHWIKGFEYVFETLRYLKLNGIIFKYNIIGNGPEFEKLIFLKDQLGLKSEIKFLGSLNSNDIVHELLNTDIYLQYSIEEGFCNATLEAQALGCLCIVSDASGLVENVINYETGFIVEKRNSEKLLKKILEVINLNDETKALIRQRAITRVQKVFNYNNQKKLFIKFYG